MDVRIAYCSACDRNVRITVPEGVEEWPTPENVEAGEAVCLEHGETCTGSMCPLFDVPPDTMKNNLDEHRASNGGES